MDLYGSFKLGIRHLSVQGKEKKRPEDFVKGDDAVDEYMESLNNLLCFDAKKCNLKKWWSQGVMEMLHPMHLAYTSEFNGGQKTADWLAEKATAHKTKFETDQKNRLENFAKKRKAEEEEQIDVAKNRKAVAEASAQLVLAFQKFSTPPAKAENVGAMVEEKMVLMKMEIKTENWGEVGGKLQGSKGYINFHSGPCAWFGWK